MGIIFPVNGKWGYLSHNHACEVPSPLLKGGIRGAWNFYES